MFSEARKADMDLDELGRRMKSRKEQLQANGGILGLGGSTVPRLNA
jgi:hypothetical protein